MEPTSGEGSGSPAQLDWTFGSDCGGRSAGAEGGSVCGSVEGPTWPRRCVCLLRLGRPLREGGSAATCAQPVLSCYWQS